MYTTKFLLNESLNENINEREDPIVSAFEIQNLPLYRFQITGQAKEMDNTGIVLANWIIDELETE